MLNNVKSLLGLSKFSFELLPSVVALYEDLFSDESKGQLDNPENLSKIMEFVLSKMELMSDHIAPNELVMIVCGVLGCLHPGDSSNLYLEILSKMENEG